MSVTREIKQLSKDTFFYGLGTTLQKFIGFLLFPIYARLLTKEEFGAQDLVFTAIAITSTFLLLGLPNGTARNYYDAESLTERKSILSTFLWFELFLSVPVCILLVVGTQPICTLIFNNQNLSPLFRIGVVALPFLLTSNVVLLTLRVTFQSRNFSIISTAYLLIQSLLSIIMVVFLRLGVRGIFLAYLIANVVQMGLGLIFTYQHFHLMFSMPQLKSMLAFGVPLVPASLSVWALNSSNRYFLAKLATLGDIGLLSVGFRISTIVTFVISAFLVAWGPFSFSLVNNEALARRTYSKVLTYFLLVTMVASVVLGIFAREAVLVLATPAYERSASLVPWLCFSSIAWGAGEIVGIGYSIAKKTYHITISTALGAIVSIILNMLLIPKWGITGAAVATMSGNLVILIYHYWAGQYYFFVSYEYSQIFKLVTIATITIALGAFIDRGSASWTPEILLYKISLFVTFLVSLFILKVITRKDIHFTWTYLVNRFKGAGAG
jgi:O-antigen/teichoic acid export membrane protein